MSEQNRDQDQDRNRDQDDVELQKPFSDYNNKSSDELKQTCLSLIRLINSIQLYLSEVENLTLWRWAEPQLCGGGARGSGGDRWILLESSVFWSLLPPFGKRVELLLQLFILF